MTGDHPQISSSGTGKRWPVLGGTFLSYFYDSYDLAVLSVLMPVLLKVLHIGTGEGGMLASATMIGAALGSIIMGIFAEKYGSKLAIIVSLVEFGIGSFIIIFVQSWSAWLVLRFLTGVGIGGVWGPCVSLLAIHWAPKFMARANSFMLSTFAIGWVAAAIVGGAAAAVNWKIGFLVGTTSILVAIYVRFAIPDDKPQKQPGQGISSQKVGLNTIFERSIAKKTILAFLLQFCQLGGFWGAANWIPTFLIKERGLDMAKMTTFLVVLYCGMFIGYQFFGWMGDHFGRRNTILICFVIDCFTVPTYLFVHNITFLFWFGAVMGTALGGVFGLSGAFYAELFPAHIRPLAGGFCFNVGRLGAVLTPIVVGFIGQTYGLGAGIIVSPIFFAIGVVVTLFLPETLVKAQSGPTERIPAAKHV